MTSWDLGDGPDSRTSADWGQPAAPQPIPGRKGVDASSSDPPPRGGSTGGSAPLLWLAIPLVLGVVGILVAVATSSSSLAVVAWALGGPLAIGMLGVFIWQDTQRRADPWYAENAIAPWGRRLVVVLSLVAVALSSYTIADHLSRR